MYIMSGLVRVWYKGNILVVETWAIMNVYTPPLVLKVST